MKSLRVIWERFIGSRFASMLNQVSIFSKRFRSDARFSRFFSFLTLFELLHLLYESFLTGFRRLIFREESFNECLVIFFKLISSFDPSQMKMTKQGFLTDFFLVTNFYVLKLWPTLIKKFGGAYWLKIKIKKMNCFRCYCFFVWLTVTCQFYFTSVWV